jgi:hypothetical protein
MSSVTHHMDRRVRLTNATVRQFQGREFRWGACDCARIAAWHLRQFGHRPQIAKAGSYKSALGAGAALKRAGFATLADGIDAVGLPRIMPAEAWVGDLVMGESGDAFGALGIYLGNGAMLGFHEDVPCATVLRRVHIGTGWRVE